MCVADVTRQHAEVPVGLFGQREEEIGLRATRPQRRDAAVGGFEELARVTERMPQRFVRLPDVFQVSGQAVDELQRGEFRCTGNMALQNRSRTAPGSSTSGSVKTAEIPAGQHPRLDALHFSKSKQGRR